MHIFEPHGMCLLALMLLLMQLNPSDAISARIGTGYNIDAADAVPNSLYVTGVSVPAAKAKTNSVTYEVLVQLTSSKHGYTLFSEYFHKSQYVAMFGPSGHDFIDSYCNNAPQENALWNLMNFAAVGQTHDTGYCFFPSYRPNIMYLFPNDVAQSAGLLHHLEQRDLFPTTQLLLYDSQDDTGVGFSAFQLFGNLMPWVNKNGFQSTTTDSTSTYDTMIAANPRIVFFFSIGEYSATAKQWYMQMMSDSKLVPLNTTLAFTMELQYQMLVEYNAQVASNKVVLTESNMASSASVPGVDTSDYPYTQEFLAQVSLTGKSVCEQNFMLAGWLAGWALMQALSKFTGPQYGVRSTFFSNLNAAQSSYIVSGFFFGSFGPPECSDSQTSQGGVCNCHQGGNNVWLQTFKKGAGGTYDVETAATPPYRYGVGMCSNTLSDQTRVQPPVPYTQVLSMPTTVHLVGFSPADNAVVSAVCSEMHDSLTRSANTTRFWHKSINAVRGHCMPTAIASVISDLAVYLASFVTTSFCGAIPDILLTSDSPPTSLILDFIPQTTQPRIAKANYVYLFPTLDQELHVLAHFVTTQSDDTSAVCGLVKPSGMSSLIEALLSNTLTADGISVSIIKLNGSMGQSIPATCTYTFVIGAADTDIGGLVSYLQSNGNYILVPFDDLTKLYSSIVLAMDGVAPDVTNRFVFATNLPALTADTMSSSEVDKAEAIADVASFVRTLPTTAQTPAAVRGYIVSMMYDRLTMGTSWGLPNLQEALYGNVTLRVGGMTFGPFTSMWSGASQKLINFGATNIAVWSYTRVVDPSTPLLASPITPSLSFLEKPSVALMDLWLAAGEADQHSCFQLQASSSSFSEPEPTPTPTPTPTQTETHHANTTSRPPVESSSSSSTLRLVAIALSALLALVVLYIVVLLMLKFEVLQRLVGCLWCCGGESTSRQDAAQLRKRFDGGCLCDLELLREARNVSRAPEESTGMVTCVVFVEVEHWRALWVRHPESMARVIRQYHRCLRRAVVKHGCYEMVSREGMYVVACPSSDAGVQLASDTVTGVAALRNSDNDIIHAAYAEFGFGDGVASGLRLRVAVHTGAVERHADASSRVHLRGNAVDGAVSAAYCAGRPGMAVVTANTMRRLCDIVAGELLKAEVVGKCRFVSESAEEELLGIWLLRAQRPSTVACRLHDTDANVALHILGNSSFESTPAFTLCKERLTMHYAEIPQQERVADLMWMNQRFGLPEVLVGRYQNDHELCDALMASVSGHISCMMECRHGVLRAARLQRRGIRELNASRSQMGEWGIRCNLSVPGRRSYRRITSGIRTFAYSKHHEKSEPQTNVETR